MLVYITSLIVVGGTFLIHFMQVIVPALWRHTVFSVGLGMGKLWVNMLTPAGQSGLDVNAAGYT
jgi:hypothetical protein